MMPLNNNLAPQNSSNVLNIVLFFSFIAHNTGDVLHAMFQMSATTDVFLTWPVM